MILSIVCCRAVGAARSFLAGSAAFAVLCLIPLVLTAQTGLPVPRFVSLRADEVNVRTGPGVRYPIEWVFVRRDLPVEITAEFDTWRKIRDREGTEGWVHQSMLSGKRTVVVVDEMRTFRLEADDGSAPVAQAEPGVIAELDGCRAAWCRVEGEGHTGWLHRNEIWGVYANERFE